MKRDRYPVPFAGLVALACAIAVFVAVALEPPIGAGADATVPGNTLRNAVAPSWR